MRITDPEVQKRIEGEFDEFEKELLTELKEEREKFIHSNSDEAKMKELVDLLVTMGVYPESTPVMEKYHYNHMTMMQSWGVDWHRWKEPHNCPKCGSDWCDRKLGPPFKREIGISDLRRDRTTQLACPDCKSHFDRFTMELVETSISCPVS